MMRLAKLTCVNSLVARRTALLKDRIEAKIGVTFDGRYDDAMVDLVRPVLHRELDARIAECDRRLVELGVSID